MNTCSKAADENEFVSKVLLFFPSTYGRMICWSFRTFSWKSQIICLKWKHFFSYSYN